MQLGVWPRATFVDVVATLKSFEIMIGNEVMRAIIGDQIGKVPTGGRAGFKPAIVPACIEIEIFQRGFANEW